MMEHSPESAYTLMRVAMQQFNKPLQQLDDQEKNSALLQANRELAIAKKLLDAEVAAHVIIPDSAVEQAFMELRERFDSPEDFELALEYSDLDEIKLRKALTHELKIEAVIEQLFSTESRVSDEEVEIYYYQHLEKFELPETRTARHILVTVNEDYPENTREEAIKRISTIRSELLEHPEFFMTLAIKYSECPTAMHEGLLGRVKPGQLYPELDTALFSMHEGEVSDILTSPVGLHLLLCEEIHPSGRLAFEEVKEKLREHLESKKRKHLLRDWLKQAA